MFRGSESFQPRETDEGFMERMMSYGIFKEARFSLEIVKVQKEKSSHSEIAREV